MALRLYNTTSRTVEDFKPLEEKKAGMYACGPTVYNYAHIGNLRTFIFEDLLKRTMTFLGYKVKHVMNITDVGHLTDDGDDGEDKMIKSAREQGMTVWDIAQFFTDAFLKDSKDLNIIKPTVVSKATEHIEDMISLIKRLEDNGFTYISGGNVYFDTEKFDGYGKMANLDKVELKSGARIVVDENKNNPRDFVLWFTHSKYENHAMLWDSPWGRGYPGWHIECSAMSMKYLGEQFDIHCGGIDLIPVHHTNEIAQSEAATGKKWVNYWVHGEFLLTKKAKMSKSSGNFLTLQSLVDQGYDALDYRYFCLGGHYRTQLVFSMEALDSAKAARKKLIARIAGLKESVGAISANSTLSEAGSKIMADFEEHASNDLNMPRCLSDLWGCLKEKDISDEEKLNIVLKMDEIFGLSLKDAHLEEEPAGEVDEDIQKLIDERNQARKDKNFQRADDIRDELLARGIQLVDTPQGTTWKKV